MGTEAGRRFLEAAPIPVGFEPEQRMPNAVARVLWPLQIGVVMVLLGVGLLFLRNPGSDMHIPMLVLGTVVLMPGIGFILSAGITWVLAGRLGADSRQLFGDKRDECAPQPSGQAVSRRGSGCGQEAMPRMAWEFVNSERACPATRIWMRRGQSCRLWMTRPSPASTSARPVRCGRTWRGHRATRLWPRT